MLRSQIQFTLWSDHVAGLCLTIFHLQSPELFCYIQWTLPNFPTRELDFVKSLWLGAVVVHLKFTGSRLKSITRKMPISMFPVYNWCVRLAGKSRHPFCCFASIFDKQWKLPSGAVCKSNAAHTQSWASERSFWIVNKTSGNSDVTDSSITLECLLYRHWALFYVAFLLWWSNRVLQDEQQYLFPLRSQLKLKQGASKALWAGKGYFQWKATSSYVSEMVFY